MGGVLELSPGVAGLFLVAAFSLAGMPPFSGFLAKFVLIRAGLTGEYYLIVLVSILTSFLTLYSMSKIWSYAFWRDRCREKAAPNYRGMMIPTSVLVIFTIVMGVWAQPFCALGERTANQLKNPDEYIAAVMPATQRAHRAHRAGLCEPGCRPYERIARIPDSQNPALWESYSP